MFATPPEGLCGPLWRRLGSRGPLHSMLLGLRREVRVAAVGRGYLEIVRRLVRIGGPAEFKLDCCRAKAWGRQGGD